MSNSDFTILKEETETEPFETMNITEEILVEYAVIIICIFILMRLLKIVVSMFCPRACHRAPVKVE